MDTTTALSFMNKALEKTKSAELIWSTLSSDFPLKSLLDDEQSATRDTLSQMNVSRKFSFVAKYKNGYLLLLAFPKKEEKLIVSPPDSCLLSLRVQEQKTTFSTEISNTQWDPVDDVALRRLYNVIDKSESSIAALIQDFLDS